MAGAMLPLTFSMRWSLNSRSMRASVCPTKFPVHSRSIGD